MATPAVEAMNVRTHVVLPENLIREVDRRVGARRRSRFIEEAIRERLAREALSSALRESAGVLEGKNYPDWDSPEDVSGWVRGSRREDDARLKRRLKPGES
jgi:Arc/MetJ-type ribon-helix-helix transcriptional regulator